MIYAVAVVGLFVTSAAFYLLGAWVDPKWVARARRTRVLVHTTDDRTLRGVLLEADRESVVLANAEYLDRSGATALAGDVWVPRGRVRFIQTIPGGDR